jgi:sugar lactone lactonase YvrE
LNTNAFVAKIDTTGDISYATYLGGSSNDTATAIAVDANGDAYIGGNATSSNFPVTKNAFSRVLDGSQDAFIAKLNPTGSELIYATYLGGSSSEFAGGLAIDGTGNCYVTGTTSSNNFPTTPGGFITTAPEYGTSWYVTKLNSTGTKLVYSTYLLGSPYSQSAAIAVNADGFAFVSGSTYGTFPTTPGALRTAPAPEYSETDTFLVKVSVAGTELNYSTLLGSAGTQTVSTAVAFDGKGGLYITGWTNSVAFPVTAGALQTTNPKSSEGQSGFVTKINFNSPAGCEPSVSPSSLDLPGSGGKFAFELTLAPGCPWEALVGNNVYYETSITLNQPTHGVISTSPIKVTGTVGQNNSTSSGETMSVSVGTATFTVNQAAGSCQAPVITPPGTLSYDSLGGLRDIGLVLPSGCSWTAVSSAPWLTVTVNPSGTGPATITVFAGQNSFSTRTAILTIDGQPITVNQSGGKCTATAAATPLNFPAGGSTGTASITTSSSSCDWSAYSPASWIELVPEFSNGQGSGIASFLVAPNPGTLSRTGSILIGNQTLTITQSAGPAGSVSGYTLSVIAGGGNSSVPNLGDGGPATSAYLNYPAGLAFDPATGNLYIADSNNYRIRVVTPNGNINTFAGGGSSTAEDVPALSAELFGPSQLAVDPSSSVYVSDSTNRVRKISNGVILTFAGSISPGFGGDDGLAISALMNDVRGIAADSRGNIYIADGNNSRVREVSDGIITTFAGGGTAGVDNGGPATSATLGYPIGVAIDHNQNVYIADDNDSLIREVSQGTITTFAAVSYPNYIAVDPLGNVFAVLSEYKEIMSISTAGAESDVVGNGVLTYVYPNGIATDPAGNVYFSDWSSSLVRKLTPVSSFCSYSVDAPAGKIASAGGTVKISITATSGCNWTAYSASSWAAVSSGSSGNGNGSVSLTVAANTTTSARNATLGLAGQLIAHAVWELVTDCAGVT